MLVCSVLYFLSIGLLRWSCGGGASGVAGLVDVFYDVSIWLVLFFSSSVFGFPWGTTMVEGAVPLLLLLPLLGLSF